MANDREQQRERKDTNTPRPRNDEQRDVPLSQPDPYRSVIKKSENEPPKRGSDE